MCNNVISEGNKVDNTKTIKPAEALKDLPVDKIKAEDPEIDSLAIGHVPLPGSGSGTSKESSKGAPVKTSQTR